MLSLNAYFPLHLDSKKAEQGPGAVDIPGVRRIPESCLPQPLLDLNKQFTKQFIDNGRENINADGILVNTFDALEPAALAALRDGKVVPGFPFPPVYAIGPLRSVVDKEDSSSSSPVVAWLDKQPARSVVYVAFGNRSAVSHAHIREIAAGLEASGCRFLWVLKTTKVDRDDTAELTDVLGEGFLERLHQQQGQGQGQGQHGMVTKEWVDQEALLKHASVGLYLSHSGWNSVTEAAAAGVPLLAWPRGGDHRVNVRHGRGERRRRGVDGALELGRGGLAGDRGGDRGESKGGHVRRGGQGKGDEDRRGSGHGRRRGWHQLPEHAAVCFKPQESNLRTLTRTTI
jgi:hypothetical protein